MLTVYASILEASCSYLLQRKYVFATEQRLNLHSMKT